MKIWNLTSPVTTNYRLLVYWNFGWPVWTGLCGSRQISLEIWKILFILIYQNTFHALFTSINLFWHLSVFLLEVMIIFKNNLISKTAELYLPELRELFKLIIFGVLSISSITFGLVVSVTYLLMTKTTLVGFTQGMLPGCMLGSN